MTSRRSTMSRQEAGRKGAEARWGKRSESQSQPSRSSATNRGVNQENQSRTNRQEFTPRGKRTTSQFYPESFREINRGRGQTSAEEYEPFYFREITRRREADFNENNPEFNLENRRRAFWVSWDEDEENREEEGFGRQCNRLQQERGSHMSPQSYWRNREENENEDFGRWKDEREGCESRWGRQEGERGEENEGIRRGQKKRSQQCTGIMQSRCDNDRDERTSGRGRSQKERGAEAGYRRSEGSMYAYGSEFKREVSRKGRRS